MQAYSVMSRWLADAPRPLILGADLNTWRDPVDLIEAGPADPYCREYSFVGPNPPHGLRDAFRAKLERKGQLGRIRRERPCGPLAVSHVIRSGAPHRMDRIFVSPDLIPMDGGYELYDAVRAGSDHALHWIELADT